MYEKESPSGCIGGGGCGKVLRQGWRCEGGGTRRLCSRQPDTPNCRGDVEGGEVPWKTAEGAAMNRSGRLVGRGRSKSKCESGVSKNGATDTQGQHEKDGFVRPCPDRPLMLAACAPWRHKPVAASYHPCPRSRCRAPRRPCNLILALTPSAPCPRPCPLPPGTVPGPFPGSRRSVVFRHHQMTTYGTHPARHHHMASTPPSGVLPTPQYEDTVFVYASTRVR